MQRVVGGARTLEGHSVISDVMLHLDLCRSSKSSGLSGGAIAGIVIGAVAAVALAGLLAGE